MADQDTDKGSWTMNSSHSQKARNFTNVAAENLSQEHTMNTWGPILFFDIASGPPLRTFAPNPWKIRYALNFKEIVPYSTQWVQMPDITETREKLGIPANRTLPDGSPYHTLPAIYDAATKKAVGDSFEIAQYLDLTYPTKYPLFREKTTGLTAAFNAHVDGLFTKYTILADKMPFDPSNADQIAAIFAQRAKAMGIQQLALSDEAREKMLVQFENSLGEFVKAYYHVGGTTDYFWSETGTAPGQAQRGYRAQVGPFLDGDDMPVYADFIVGAWLAMFEASLRDEEWQRLRTWQGGFWARLHDALARWREIK